MSFSRRDFVKTSVLGAVAAGVGTRAEGEDAPAQAHDTQSYKRPIIVCAHNGLNYLDDAFAFLKSGGDTLDAALRVVKGPEDDPNDTSVGLGGIPNEEGVVELDACCMHGPTRRAGSVGGVRNIKNVSLVSKAVFEHTGHVMLVGEGAERFAVAMGFPRENLLTEHSRKIWLLWKEYHSNEDWWGPGLPDPRWQAPDVKPSDVKPNDDKPQSELWQERYRRLEEHAAELGIEPELRRDAVHTVLFPPTGTIHCSALNEKGEISGCTTTSGLGFKLPGRCGDSPIIGAGCYTDQDVGSAGATGSGEENIKVAGAHTIVENMRRGMSPQEAGMETLKRIVRNYNSDMNKLRFVDMTYYILRKDGAYAGVSLWEGYSPTKLHKIAVHDGTRRAEKTVAMFKGYSQDFPPEPNVPADVRKEFK
ncbi:MAG TPA: N(4)-(beta-N-acetylglucosaminyl)-L-asparaginase [Candidatus Dormibacteraeota bacterium]|jgi:N4-(beta-N-acetylglucosaminyl)-L-asparaginase|nr:N(4)-(beta-N-acetylglucosaminyl)-L-asparaginase [Candidatus Dormibacteraeota bacterium]